MGFSTDPVPHDGSSPSYKALDTAIELVKMSKNPHIILLHVIPEMEIPPVLERPIRSRKTGETTNTTEYWKELYEDIQFSVLKLLDERKNKCEKEGISAETRSVIGYPSDIILRNAVRDNVDIIVMGTTGLRGISKIKALGSVARRVSEQAVCPVILIH